LGWLSLVAGSGLHKFYLGQTGWGIAYFMFSWTYIPALLGIAEGIYLINISMKNLPAIMALRRSSQTVAIPYLLDRAAIAKPEVEVIYLHIQKSGSQTQHLSTREILAALADLKDLYDRGIITAEEYEEKRQKFLRSL
jgi:TM2 domain-containing membrane protein YozV